MTLKDMAYVAVVTLLVLNYVACNMATNEQSKTKPVFDKEYRADKQGNFDTGRLPPSTLDDDILGTTNSVKSYQTIHLNRVEKIINQIKEEELKLATTRPSFVTPKVILDAPTLVKIEEKFKLATTTATRPRFVIPEVNMLEPARPVPDIEPTPWERLDPLQLPYRTEEEFWGIVASSYREICGTCTWKKEEVCSQCWCDPSCVLHGDCCPEYYLEHGYTPPLDPTTQGCGKTTFPGTVDRPFSEAVEIKYYKMITSCNASQSIIGDSEGIKKDKTARSMMENLQMPAHEVESLCLNPDISAHWNFTRPVTDSATSLIYKNQYCAACNNISTDTLLPWTVSAHPFSSQLLWESTSLLELYQEAFRDPEVMEFEYKAQSQVPEPQRECENDNRYTLSGVHYTKCNETGKWTRYSRLAERACELLDLPIRPRNMDAPWIIASYKNPFCLYCNHDIPYERLLYLQPYIAPGGIIHGLTNSLSVLLDLDGSDTPTSFSTDQLVEATPCGDGYIFSPVQNKCLETICAQGKTRGPDLTCKSPPGIESNAFGYTACYLVTGLKDDNQITKDLMKQLQEQPRFISKASFDEAMGEQYHIANDTQDFGENLEEEGQEALSWKYIQTLQPTSAVVTSWECNECPWLGYDADTGSIFVQASWASIHPFNRDLLDSAITSPTGPLLDVLYNLAQSSRDNSDGYAGNISIVKHPICELERLPVFPFVYDSLEEMFSALKVSPAPCKEANYTTSSKMGNSVKCTMDALPSVTIPRAILEVEKKKLEAYAVSAKYLPVNDLLFCQYVEVSVEEYTFDTVSWTVKIRGCNDSAISAEDVHISKLNRTLFVCASDYISHCKKNSTSTVLKDQAENKHQKALGILSLVCTLISMTCCLVTFLVYTCVPKLRSAAGVNNMVLTFLLFFAHGLVQFGGGIVEAGTSDEAKDNDTAVDGEQMYDNTSRVACVCVGIATHFFWLAAVTAMTTATFHMFFALSFPLKYQKYRGRDFVVIRAYIIVDLVLPILMISGNLIYSTARARNLGYAAHKVCFVNAGIPKIVFYGVPVFVLIVANIVMYIYTVVSLRRTPQIGETKTDRRHAALYARLSVSTGIAWIFGFLHEFTGVIVFAYAFILTALLVGLFVFWAYVLNRKVINMVRERGRELWQAAHSRSSSGGTTHSTSSGYYKSDNVRVKLKASSKEAIV